MNYTVYKPRDYQIPGIQKLSEAIRENGSALDMSDTGTGKTFKALWIAQALGMEQVAVLCPKVVIPQWERACRDLGVKPLWINTYDKARRGNIPGISRRGHTYAFSEFPPNTLLLFDEVQRCQGARTKQGRLLIDAHRHGIPKLMMSATPADSPLQMRGIGYAMGLFHYNEWWSWCQYHGKCIEGQFGGLEYYGGPEFMAELRTQMDWGIDRVRKADIKDWKNQFVQPEIIESNKLKAIDNAYAEMLAMEAEETPWALTELLRLRQQVEHCKIPAVAEMVENYTSSGNQVLVMCNFRDTLENLNRIRPGLTLHGDTEDRGDVARAFQAGEQDVLYAMTQCAREGVNLHDIKGTPVVSIILPTYSARDFIQACGRTDRDGALSDSVVKVPLVKDTVEERVFAKLEAKRERIEALVDGDFLPN